MKAPLFHLQYELPLVEGYSEPGSRRGSKLRLAEVADGEVRESLAASQSLPYKRRMAFVAELPTAGAAVRVLPLTSRTPQSVEYRLSAPAPKLVYVARPLHTIEQLDDYLAAIGNALPVGGYLSCHTMTTLLQRKLFGQRYAWGVRHVVSGAHYLWHRVAPKLRLTRGLYFRLTQGKRRSLSRVEAMGRVARAGFEVVGEEFSGGEFFMVAVKRAAPLADTAPTGSPVVHLRRVGKGGREIVVHKFRTMYTYSEYLQPYVSHYQGLASGGKFKDDYRVNFWGRLLRRTWLDELPMVWNLVRGDIKLVGVRPLSRQYLGLYSPEMQRLHTSVKPGLLPPFYYERRSPQTLDEVQASERRYIEAYHRAPFRTDWRYFWGIVGNIVLRRKHSR